MKFSSDRSSPSPVSTPDDDAPARHGDVETLRRLTREAFGEITSIRDRVRAVERNLATERASRASERVRVDTRAGRCWGVGHAGAVAATRPGLDCATTVEAPFPGGDSMTARFSTTTTAAVDDADAPAPSPYERVANVANVANVSSHAPTVTLEKLMYRKRVGRDGWIRLAPVGGEGQDAAATLNPFSPGRGVALTNLAAVGSPTLAECRGTALCASYDFADALFGVSGGFFSGEEPFEDGGGYQPRRLAQVTARPGTRAAMSLAVAEGPRRGARGLSMSAAGLFAVGERTLLSAWASTAKLFGPYADDGDEDAGGWGLAATAPPKDVSRSSAGTARDAVRGWGWGVVIGKEPGESAPTQIEAFARIGDERGGGINERTLCPGIVATRDAYDGRWDVAAACRVEIKFS